MTTSTTSITRSRPVLTESGGVFWQGMLAAGRSAGSATYRIGDIVLHVGFPERDGRRGLLLRYRNDVLDAGCAARIAGSHLTALRQIIADSRAEYRRQSLLSAHRHPSRTAEPVPLH
jgi:hypothetical protein